MANRNLFRLEMILLKILEEQDCYGYQITQTIKERSNNQITISEGTMYPILYKLEDQGFISAYKEQVTKRQVRIYYHLEESGKKYLKKTVEEYLAMVDGIANILNHSKD